MHEKNINSKRVYTAPPWRLRNVTPLPDYCLSVELLDGTKGIVEMSQLILDKDPGVFAKLKEAAAFNKVFLEHGAVTWPGEIDLAPDAMHDEIKRCGRFIA